MRIAEVEIYSDTTNAAVMRHPGRRFPGVLVQGDSLSIMCRSADKLCLELGADSPSFEAANDLRNGLLSLLTHYKKVLGEHGIPLPFAD